MTRWSSSDGNFCVLSSLACLFEKFVSLSVDVPYENMAIRAVSTIIDPTRTKVTR
jgi:hypothetical protein